MVTGSIGFYPVSISFDRSYMSSTCCFKGLFPSKRVTKPRKHLQHSFRTKHIPKPPQNLVQHVQHAEERERAWNRSNNQGFFLRSCTCRNPQEKDPLYCVWIYLRGAELWVNNLRGIPSVYGVTTQKTSLVYVYDDYLAVVRPVWYLAFARADY